MPNTDVEEIKSRLDIVQVIGESVPLKKAGRNFKGLCPFHKEKSPSFMVNPERQGYHCFGCGEGGDVFEYVMKRESVDFPEALQMLAKRAGVELKGFDSKENKAKQRLFEVNEQATKYFEAAYAHSTGKVAQDYVKSRGLKAKTVKDFRMGYAPDDYDALIKALKNKKFTDKELIDAGLAIQGNRGPYGRFRGRLMIPIADATGVIRGFTGRVLESDGQLNGNQGSRVAAKYVNTPETSVFHKGKLVFALDLAKQSIIDEDGVVMVEGQMDVITAHQAGTTNVVATSGTALTEEQLRQMLRFSKTLVFAFDNDVAGEKALLRSIEPAENHEVEVKAVNLGTFKDPDDLISNDPKEWKKRIKDAEPIIDYLITKAFQDLQDRKPPYDRSQIKAVLSSVLPTLARRPSIDQDFYAEQLATTLGIAKLSIKTQLAELLTVNKVAKSKEAVPAKSVPIRKTPEELVAERMLGLVATTPELVPKLAELDERVLPETYQKAASALKSGYNKRTVDTEVAALIDVCSMVATEYDAMSEVERAAEFDRLYVRMKSLWVKQHQPKLLAAIKRAEAGGNNERRDHLVDEYMTITKRIAHG